MTERKNPHLLLQLNEAANSLASNPRHSLQIISSLQQQVYPETDPFTYADMLIKSAEAFRIQGYYDIAIQELNKASAALRYFQDSALSIKILRKLAACHIYKSDAVTAFSFLNKALEHCRDMLFSQEASLIYNSLGVLLLNADEYEKSLEYFYRSLEIAEKLKDHSLCSSLHNNIGEVYFKLSDFPNAQAHLEKSLSLRDPVHNRIGIAYSLNNLGNTFIEQGKYQDGIKYLQRALAIRRSLKNRKEVAASLMNIGVAYDRIHKNELALRYLKKASLMAKEEGCDALIAAIANFIGAIYYKRNDLRSAIQAFEEALEISIRLQLRANELTTRKYLAEIYEHNGDLDAAHCNLKSWVTLQNDIFCTEKQRAFARLELRHHVKALEEECSIFKERAEIAEKELAYKERELAALVVQLARQGEAVKKIEAFVKPLAANANTTQTASTGAEALMAYLHQEPQYDHWSIIEKQFESVHHNFLKELHRRMPLLTPTEIRICILSKMNLPLKQQANILFISPGTLKIHRNHIRRKLSLAADQSLNGFINSL